MLLPRCRAETARGFKQVKPLERIPTHRSHQAQQHQWRIYWWFVKYTYVNIRMYIRMYIRIYIYIDVCQSMPNYAQSMPIDQWPWRSWSVESRRSHNTLTILAWVPGNQSSATDDQHLDVSGRCLRSSHKAWGTLLRTCKSPKIHKLNSQEPGTAVAR